MQDINTTINTLREAGVHVFLDNGKLKTKSLKGTLTPVLINLIKKNKDLIIEKIKADTMVHDSPALERTTISKIERSNHKIETSFAQQRLWFIDKMDGGSSHYNMPFVLDIIGDFRVDIAQAAFTQIIKRHEPLRTVFDDGEDCPLQIIYQQFEFCITETDLSGLSTDEKDKAIITSIKHDAEYPFNLSRDLMLRVSYLHINDNEAVMLINIHHIASDGWSINIFFEEFVKLYHSILESTPSPLVPLVIQYADYAHWQRLWLQGEALESQLAYWDEKLADLPQIHSLPLDCERPVFQTFNGALYHFKLGSHILGQLKSIALENQVTLFMLVHAAFSVLLSRYSNNTDIVIGTPVSNRLQKDLEPLIGFFANTLVLRVDCSNNPTFTEFLTKIKNTNLDAQANQDVPFEHLVDRLNPTRSTSHNALFQILLMMDGDAMPDMPIVNTKIKRRASDHVPIKFELTLNFSIKNDQLACIFQYNTDLFELKTIERLADSMQCLVTAIANDPDQSIAQLPLLNDKAIQYQLHDLNKALTDYPQNLCIHQLFERQAEKTPNDVSVLFEEQSLSYSVLNKKANQLAHYLIEQGVKPDSYVGLCFERSLEMIVGLLAILKAGGAYLPLDPTFPQARLEHMIVDSGLSLLLTQQNLVAITEGQGLQHIIIDDQSLLDTLNHYSEVNPHIESLTPSHLAYLLYTSGSTGKPKGVLQKHATVVNLVHAQASKTGLKQTMKTLQFAPLSFDVSIQEIATSWFSASPLLIISNRSKDELNKLPQLLQEQHIERVFLPPAVLNWLAEELIKQDQLIPDLKEIIVAGEALHISKYLKEYLQAQPNCRLWNHYGPTETHVATIACIDSIKNKHLIPIGSVLANLSAFVLDQQHQIVPYGAIGELYIGGVGVARGYLNQAALTAERFIQNPFSDDDKEIIYATGDLVRYLAGGELAFIGRIDDQVKIRGFRIELGEIEQQLNKLADVESSLVIVNEPDDKQKRLIAYLTTESNHNSSNENEFISQLRSQLRAVLPDYMVPSAFIILQHFPLTSNGKVDRKALPQADLSLFVSEYIAPEGETELAVAAIWSELLKIPQAQVSADANFFELGGHSLLSVRLVTEIRERFHSELSIRDIFESPELRKLSTLIECSKKDNLPKIIAIKRNSQMLEPSYAQQRLWFIDQMENGSKQYNMAGSIKIDGDFDVAMAQQAFANIIERHEPLRTVFIENNNKPLQLIKEDFHFNITKTDLTQLQEQQQAIECKTIIDNNSNHCFDLSHDLMLRVHYIKLTSDQAILTINVHHIAFDGWSVSLLMHEFSEHYQALISGEKYIIPPLAIQYVDYAYWQRQWLAGAELDRQLDYWDKQLADLPQIHNLPLDFERPGFQTFNGGLYHFALEKEVFNKLKIVAIENQVTMFMLIHAAFSILLSRYANSNDIVIGTPVANRLQKALQPLIGFFVNTLVLRADCSQNICFNEFLVQIKNTNLDAQVNQDVPFEHLVDRLNPNRSTSHNALFQIMLAMNNNDEFLLDLPDVSLTTQTNEQVTAKFDLTLYATDTDNLAFTFEYNTDLFTGQTIERLARSMQRLLEGIAIDSSQPIARLPLLADEEINHLLNSLNDTQRDYPDTLCIHQLFEQQVIKTPDNIAIVCAKQSLSYAELNTKANQLAHYLIEQGFKPDDIAGLCVERSLAMMVAIIAIFKAGGAYLPLDPSYPEGRLEHMIKDSGLSLLLTQQHLADKIGNKKQQLILDGHDFIDVLSNYPPNNPVIKDLNCHHLAYVIYTSGSTGLPKGVMVEHQALLNRIDWMQNEYQLTENDVVLQKTPFSFDVSVWELTWFFTVGARLVMAEPEGHKDPAYLIDTIQKNQVTTLHFVPSMLRSILANNDWAHCHSLRQVFCSGEALAVDLPAMHYALNNALLHNLYGPTEAAIDVSYWQTPNEKGLTVVPIGKPIQNIQLLVLNEQRQLQPKGSPGELFIGGAGLARGYLNQAELTAERFIDNPFTTIASQKLYRTGDLVRYLDDGNLAFIGRVDHQVKLRGFRIELGEIEYQLSVHPEIDASVAVVREDQPGQRHLVAYFTSESESEDSVLIADIRSALQNHLPDYMVPSLYVRLQSMPLSPNGKIDRKALPQPDILSSTDDFIAAENTIEKSLVHIWAELLKVPEESLSTTANFFAMGGDSILSIQVVSRALDMQLKLTIKQLFEHQTIRDLSPFVVKADDLKIRQTPVVGEQLLLPVMRQFFTDESALDHYNQALIYKAPADFNESLLSSIVEQLYKRHDVLRLRFKKKNHLWQGYYQEMSNTMLDESLANIYVDSFTQLAHQADALQTSLSIENGPLFRAVFCQNSKHENRLLFIFHHLIIDGVSWRILIDDIKKLYKQNRQQEPFALGGKTTPYQDWAQYLHNYSNDSSLKGECSYWQGIVNYNTDSLPQSKDSALSQKSFSQLEVLFDEEITQLLLNKAPVAYRTKINELLLAGLLLGIYNWSGNKSVKVDLEGHGRQQLTDGYDLSQTMGWFTTIYPVVLESDSMQLSRLICHIKEKYRAIPNQGIGYGLLKYINQSLIFDKEGRHDSSILFNYLGQLSDKQDKQDVFSMSSEEVGQPISPLRKPQHNITLNGAILNSRLSFRIDFNQQYYTAADMQVFLNNFKSGLTQIIEHCVDPANGLLTPSDFPLSCISQQQLNHWQNSYPVENIYAATAMQQGLLYHTVLDKSAYVSQLMLTLDSHVNIEALNKSWQKMIDRHSILRTVFVTADDGEVQQLVIDNVTLPWTVHCLADLNQEQQYQQIEKNRLADKTEGFNIEQAPLLRIQLWHLGENQYRMLLTNHHAILDGWSFGLLFKEVLQCYRAYCHAKEPQLNKAVAYSNYIQWLASQDLNQAKEFWQKDLATIENSCNLSYQHYPDAGDLAVTGQLAFSKKQTTQLENIAKNCQVTVNTVLQGAWSYLLSRYCNETTVVFGTTVSGRPANLTKVEDMVGLFINTIPVRVEVECNLSIIEWLKTLHQQQIIRNEYSYLPLVEIQALADRASHSLIQSLFVFENYPIEENTFTTKADGQLNVSEFEVYEEANYNLSVMAAIVENKLNIKLSGKPDHFDKQTLDQITAHLHTIIEGIINHTDQLDTAIRQLPLLNNREKDYLLYTLNNTQTDYPQHLCIHQLFEQQVEKTPENIAIVFAGQSLTYAALNRQANQLAHYLIEHGVKPDDFVGICHERSLAMMVAILATLKAGAAYLPLDPSYPRGRLEHMINDSGLSLLITQQDLVAITEGPGRQQLVLDNLNFIKTLKNYATNNPVIESLTSKHLAYVIYTSGSTGMPKGVMLEHHGAINLALAQIEHFSVKEKSNVLLYASINFDAATSEWMMALLSGSALYICDKSIRYNPEKLADYLQLNNISHATLPPAILQHLDINRAYAFKSLIVAGEAFDEQLCRQWGASYNFYNAYGPTEVTVCATMSSAIKTERLNIGKAIPNIQLYVLDNNRQLLPTGSIGELYIGGVGLARGYLNQPKLTSERFIEHTFNDTTTARLYRSGDLVRYQDDGNLEFIGRVDHQVKIRGFRIELGEIEQQLTMHEHVKSSLVLVEEQQLLAYFTADTSMTESELISAIRSDLQNSLPDYMLPSAFICLQQFPLTPNGKIDRKALPKLESINLDNDYVAPEGAIEQGLAEIWGQLLKIPQENISANANFFELGGHSLLAIKLLTKITNKFDTNLKIESIFESKTLSMLAIHLAMLTRKDHDSIPEKEDMEHFEI